MSCFGVVSTEHCAPEWPLGSEDLQAKLPRPLVIQKREMWYSPEPRVPVAVPFGLVGEIRGAFGRGD